MDFIKARDLNEVESILKKLEEDLIKSVMNGKTCTQDTHPVKIDQKLIEAIKEKFIQKGYSVKITQGKGINGDEYSLIGLSWGMMKLEQEEECKNVKI